MTASLLTLQGVSFVLPSGRVLFHDIHETFDTRPTGLVGANGIGKSVLGRICAGVVPPTSGRVDRAGDVYYLAQQVDVADGTVASLAGVDGVLDALSRIADGSVDTRDFDGVGKQWDMPDRLAGALADAGLGHLDAMTPAERLSGGEAMRVALLGARLARARFLILDEPTNHLDVVARAELMAWLQTWDGGLLVISHDRSLLDAMERTIELTAQGLRSYGGGYTFYASQKAVERAAALDELASAKAERRRGERDMRDQAERQARRTARGARAGKTENQAPILLGRRRERSEGTAGRLADQRDETSARLEARVRQAASAVDSTAPLALRAPRPSGASRRVARLADVTLPWGPAHLRHIDLTVTSSQRIGLVGPNGCGKSTLLRLLAGDILPEAGTAETFVPFARLDQRLSQLDPGRSIVAQLQETSPGVAEGEWRSHLALAGIDAATATTPSGLLSGGERLKAALALAVMASPPARLLLLDEPTNHLDLQSVQAIEAMLREFRGALIVASHDMPFIGGLALTHCLSAGHRGWILKSA
ncbi:ABC-F family ATP-binding cassette domain-containing protein [Luteibacter yeojuensis]|uniref:ABC transporter ATP-binding protein n=1 Tax=Luteibacter yeojuensis TaxID=345309 RepID=A0A0F3KVL6_9GAMM|nr:ABC-F family ATP-binding cassette domain-containing protein [Luteibacter yeojuensis]KJV35196.1 ABC transporter ATP-binding protein [Luteibacter yeojuensis]